jgi:glycine oxidase
VVGGGIVGASIAWRLAQRGVRVDLLDSGRLGGEASWAGAGMLAPGSEMTERAWWTELALASHAGYPAFVEELSAESGEPIDYRECGGIESAFDEAEWQALQERAARQSELGIVSEPLSPSQTARLIPRAALTKMTDALHYPQDSIVDPRTITAALRTILDRLGVRILEGCRVSRLRGEPAGVTVTSEEGDRRYDAAVLAAGAWSSTIAFEQGGAIEPLPPAIPVRGHLIGWRLPPGLLGPILRHGHTYLLQRNSGFLIAGASEERVGFDRTVDPATVRAIAEQARRLLPDLTAGEPDEAWIGFRPGTAGGEPVIGRLGKSPVWAAYGHYRNGILMAPETARRIAAEITSS